MDFQSFFSCQFVEGNYIGVFKDPIHPESQVFVFMCDRVKGVVCSSKGLIIALKACDWIKHKREAEC